MGDENIHPLMSWFWSSWSYLFAVKAETRKELLSKIRKTTTITNTTIEVEERKRRILKYYNNYLITMNVYLKSISIYLSYNWMFFLNLWDFITYIGMSFLNLWNFISYIWMSSVNIWDINSYLWMSISKVRISCLKGPENQYCLK